MKTPATPSLALFTLVIACIAAATIGTSTNTKALEWTGDTNAVSITADTNLGTVSRCQDQPITVVVPSDSLTGSDVRDVIGCVTKGSHLDIALSYYTSDGSSGVAVRMGSDPHFRQLNINAFNLAYSSSGDTLSYREDYYRDGLYAVNNASSNIVPTHHDKVGNITMYGIKPGTDELQLQYSTPIPTAHHSVYSHAMSSNGKYIAAYVDYAGFVLIDLAAHTSRTLKPATGFWYSTAYNPYVAAVSNDGRYIATGYGLTIIDSTDCGVPVKDNILEGLIVPCPEQDYNGVVTDAIGYNPHIKEAKFSDNTTTLELDVEKSLYSGIFHGDGQPKHVTLQLPEAPAADDRLEYLALGDSYSSGEGDMADNSYTTHYIKGTEANGMCHISSRSYPYLLSAAWGYKKNEMESVACSNALLTKDYATSIEHYQGQHDELSELDTRNRSIALNQAINKFDPGVVPQLEFIKKYKPKVVTLTGGGNDVGFARILEYCAADVVSWFFSINSHSCGYVDDDSMRKILNDSIDSRYYDIKRVISSIRDESPDTKIYYVGYPSFIAGTSGSCALNSGLLNGKEREMINNAVKRLNHVIKEASAGAGAQYIDIESALDGGRLCEGSKYVTGVWDEGLLKGNRQESFHPNSLGHIKIAEAITSKITNPIASYKPTVPSPSVVTIEPGTHTERARIVKDTTVKEGEMLEIKLEPGDTLGESDVFVGGFSAPTKLGRYVTMVDGSLDVQIQLPKSMGAGAHLIVLDITDSSGEPRRLFEFIDIEKSQSSTSSSEAEDATTASGMSSKKLAVASKVLTAGNDDKTESANSLLDDPTPSSPIDKQHTNLNNVQTNITSIYIFVGIIVSTVGGLWLYGKKR